MTFAEFMKATFGVFFGYDLDAAVALFDEERAFPGSPLTGMDRESLDDVDYGFGYPQPYFSLTGQVPSRTLVAWRFRCSAVV